MEPCLENIFHKYLITDLNSKNYAKNLTKLITFFISKGRFLEARFYLDQLEKTHSGNIISICLGYKLAITLFDNQSVIKYDKLLYLNRKNDFELEWYRLQYYYSVNNIPRIRESSKFLLSNSCLERNHIETISEVVWNTHDYEITVMFHKYAIKNKIRFTDQMDRLIRNIVLENLRDLLVMYKNV
ncbi:hypothetical protein LVY74_14550 [Acinetobacter sp. ME22]|uniref:hypothetical protein n=1 Tax=Acinetobacter sp. ME22 TaxID=2904802 RepID=UPI001EDBD3F1|nr:hypothetical protein [Acinetobacter sp. ME22]MCG2574765.1 hypothetical protein [Acinetobacter sp. ME22]